MITKEAEGALAALTQEILHVFPELTPPLSSSTPERRTWSFRMPTRR